MRAAQHEHVHLRALQRRQILACDQLGGGMLEPPFLDERHEQRAGLAVDACIGAQRLDRALVRAARNGPGGADHTDRPRLGRCHCGARTRFDHADDGYSRALLQVAERVRGARIARDDHGFHAAIQQIREDLAAIAPHGIRRFRPVRHARGVAEIDHRLVREPLEQRARDGQAADPRVEHPERGFIHGTGY